MRPYKIAFIDGWPNLPFNAEREFIRRAEIACNGLGISIIRLTTSDEILAAQPDLVVATHEFTPKLTNIITIGAMWSPPEFFENDPVRIRNILSYDGYLKGSEHVEVALGDIFSTLTNSQKPISEFIFLPSCHQVAPSRQNGSRRTLMYSGIHWDGLRHGELFYRLAKNNKINVYGPKASWNYISSAHRGELPLDGSSLLAALSHHGMALCIHKEAHRKANTPSMRLFEAAAVGSLIISDEIKFAREVFGDTIFYVDTKASYEEQAERITEIATWAEKNASKADEMANESRLIFEKNWSLNKLIPKIVEFEKKISSEKYSYAKQRDFAGRDYSLDVIIRTGSRNLSFVERAIQSALSQSGIKVTVLLVTYAESPDLYNLIDRYKKNIKHIKSIKTGYRSTALWDGLRNVTSDYFAMLDDDDTVEPDHFANLLYSLTKSPNNEKLLAYSGVLRIEEDGEFISAVNFSGPQGKLIPENKELKFLDYFDPDRLIMFDNYIQSNAWVAKRDILSHLNLADPCLEVAEDMYLYILFLDVVSSSRWLDSCASAITKKT